MLTRFNFVAYVMFSALNTIVYCIPAGWLWGGHGFLYQMGAVDIAGSCGVHLCGGASGKVIVMRFENNAFIFAYFLDFKKL